MVKFETKFNGNVSRELSVRSTIVQEKGESYRSETRADYTYFNKVEENDTHYFLYLSSMQCHVIPKNSITEGTLEDFNRILIQNLGLRFKSKKI